MFVVGVAEGDVDAGEFVVLEGRLCDESLAAVLSCTTACGWHPFCPRPGFQKRLGQRLTAVGRIVSHYNFAEFFAELCATEAPIIPLGSSVLR